MASPLCAPHRQLLLNVARSSVQHGLRERRALAPELVAFPREFHEERATFVTLYLPARNGDKVLQGCIGSLKPHRPLVVDVARNAYAAAFEDRRGRKLLDIDLNTLEIHISLLHPPEPMTFVSEDDLVAQVRPGVDGLIVEENGHRGTLLPSVWESLPDPREFVRHVKLKAGLSPSYWSSSLRFYRYTTEAFPE